MYLVLGMFCILRKQRKELRRKSNDSNLLVWAEKFIWWRQLFNDVMTTFFINESSTATPVEELCKLQRKQCWKKTSSGNIPWEYVGQSMNFSADPRFKICVGHKKN